MSYEFEITRRVEFSETDMAGIMHFSNFFRFMESAEHGFFRSLGFSVAGSRNGLEVCLPRVHAECDYAVPLRFEDEVQVRLLVERKGRRSLTYQFRFSRLNGSSPQEVARGRMTVACVERKADGAMKAVPLPKGIADKIQRGTGGVARRRIPVRSLLQFLSAAGFDPDGQSVRAAPLHTTRVSRQLDNLFYAMNDTIVSNSSNSQGSAWLVFSLLTVGCWGLYGAFLHSGQQGMHDPVNGRYKAFLCVGVAYFLTAVLAPLAMLWLEGATWSFSPGGVAWSVLAGIVGAVGAFGVLLAFGAKGTPAVVMSIVFAGAPVLNAIYSMALHPPAGGWQKLPWPFVLGIVLAAIGGCLVSALQAGAGCALAQAGDHRTGGIARRRRRRTDASIQVL